MFFYIIIVAILIVLLFFCLVETVPQGISYKPTKKMSQKVFERITLAFLLFLWFLTAFRGNTIGNDTNNYIYYFKEISKYGVDKAHRIEMGYQYFCLFISKINANPQFFLVISSAICYIGVGIYIFKYSNNKIFSLVLLFALFFSMFTNTIRQNLAMTIVLWAYHFLKNKKYIFAISLIFLATIFHKSALIAILLFFYKLAPYKQKTVFMLSLMIIALSITGVVNTILRVILPSYTGYFEGVQAGSGRLMTFIGCIRNAFFYFLVYKVYKKEGKFNRLVLWNFALLLFLQSFGFVVNLFDRVSSYFLLIGIVELTNICCSEKLKNRDLWMFAIGCGLLLFFLVSIILRPEWNHLYPYLFFWE